jgi:signal transduction histidine kinase
MESAELESRFSNSLLTRDIVNRMTAAMHFLEKSCKSSHLSEEDRQALDIVKKEITAAFALAAVVRDWSRVAVLGDNECGEATDVCATLSDAIVETKRVHFDRDVTVNMKRPETPCHAMGTPLLGRMFFNLLTNAVKFDPSPKVLIDVTVEEAEHKGDEFWCIRFADRGRGIPDHEKEKIFERHHRLDTSVLGAGLGLPVVRRIAKVCGGLVWAENRVSGDFSKGTIMVVMLRKAAKAGPIGSSRPIGQ